MKDDTHAIKFAKLCQMPGRWVLKKTIKKHFQTYMGRGLKMRFDRLPIKDPRTIARDIPGIFEVIFPQLAPGVVTYLNKKGVSFEGIVAVPSDTITASKLNRAMLFEVAFARAELFLLGNPEPDWNECLSVAHARQRRYFDAELPSSLDKEDRLPIALVADNLAKMISWLRENASQSELSIAPEIPGYQWIASGSGDFAIGNQLVEVKCSNARYGAADYRQVLMYWLLSYAASIEHDFPEWRKCILLNPRLNFTVEFSFDDLISVTAAGRSKVEILELFSTMIGDYAVKLLPDYKQ